MIYFVADTHFGHANILKLSNRPFQTIEEMDEALIANWNSRVKGNDTVYILGDLIHKSQEPEKYLRRLKGKKVLIIGNHDKTWLKKIAATKYFTTVTPFLELNVLNKNITLCHYPMLEWNGSRKIGSKKLGYLIHGHVHNRVSETYLPLYNTPNALNAGVDVNGFKPVTLEELIENNKTFKENVIL